MPFEQAIELELAANHQPRTGSGQTPLRAASPASPGEWQATGDQARPARLVYPAGLSRREVEVLRLVAAGRSNTEIAVELHLSLPTVKNHVAHIRAKIGAENRAAAAAFAARHGLA